ncbi:MAG TPA: type VI secretion system tube protein TssD [Symbiobacteriaceae bacterium]|nr:type VI secretion system tube protein TssD [Symbiobacteriaceae bacterium]
MIRKLIRAAGALILAAGILALVTGFASRAEQGRAQAASFDTGLNSHWMTLKIAGQEVEVEATRGGRKGMIEALYFENAVATTREAGSGLATGRRQYQPLLIRKRIDKSSPLLMKALTQNQPVEASFNFYRPSLFGDSPEELFYTVQIRNARVNSVKIVQESGSEPVEEVTFVFHTITWTYTNGGVTHEDTWDQQR